MKHFFLSLIKLKNMKKFFLFLLSLPFITLAQSPQGVGYQGVATDINGVELINQSIIAPLANFRSKFHASPSGNKIISLDLSIAGGGSVCVDVIDYNYYTLDRYQNVLILRF